MASPSGSWHACCSLSPVLKCSRTARHGQGCRGQGKDKKNRSQRSRMRRLAAVPLTAAQGGCESAHGQVAFQNVLVDPAETWLCHCAGRTWQAAAQRLCGCLLLLWSSRLLDGKKRKAGIQGQQSSQSRGGHDTVVQSPCRQEVTENIVSVFICSDWLFKKCFMGCHCTTRLVLLLPRG